MIDPRKAELAAADHGYFAMTLGARELKYMRSFKKGRLRVNVYFTTGTVGRLSRIILLSCLLHAGFGEPFRDRLSSKHNIRDEKIIRVCRP